MSPPTKSSDTMPDPTEKYSSLVAVDPGGDVILGFPKDGILKGILVQSHILKLTCRPLAAMFSSRWAEGQELQSRPPGVPVEVLLPDDDFEAFSIISKILHYRPPGSNKTIEGKLFYKIASTASKYQLESALYYFGSNWFAKFLDHSRSDDQLWIHLLSAYLLRQSQPFWGISRELVLHCDKEYIQLFHQEDWPDQYDDLAWNVTVKLESLRGESYRELADTVLAEITDESMDMNSLAAKLRGKRFRPPTKHSCKSLEDRYDFAGKLLFSEDRFSEQLGDVQGICLGCIMSTVDGKGTGRGLHECDRPPVKWPQDEDPSAEEDFFGPLVSK